MDTIEAQLLKNCLKIFDEISSQEANDFYGTPPKSYYIDYGIGSKRKIGYLMIELEKTYKYESGQLVLVPVGTKHKNEPINGMYFPEGHAEIGINQEGNIAFFSFQVGPRYGRGYKYEIIKDPAGSHLGEEQSLWIS